MTLELARVQRLSEVISEKRAGLTGHHLAPPDAPNWPAEAVADALFARLVSSMYMWFHEKWGDEIHYLVEVAAKIGVTTADVRKFEGLIIDLRTWQQHSTTSESIRRSLHLVPRCHRSGEARLHRPLGEMRRRACGGMQECALRELVAVVNAIAEDGSAAAEWIARVEAATWSNPAAHLAVVLADLGLTLSPGQRKYLAQAIEHDWGRRLNALPGSQRCRWRRPA